MPAGTPKVTMFGGGLTPGGSQTFNVSGTWPAPPGVKKVNFNARGGSGNPGNPGNPGQGGGGGYGGGGGSAVAYRWQPSCCNPAGGCYVFAAFGGGGCLGPGGYGNAFAGNAGNPGTNGSVTTVFGFSFPGGTLGNGGTAGNGGISIAPPGGFGSAGTMYYGGGPSDGASPGGPGNAGPFGGCGGSAGCPFATPNFSGGGGGGAGSSGAGSPGSTPNGGSGGAGGGGPGGQGATGGGYGSPGSSGSNPFAGGGGGGGTGFAKNCFNPLPYGVTSGGGGGGGRANVLYPGNPGNAGNPGNFGTPGSQACVNVTGGSSYPVTVGPGGFVTISWNPQ